MPPHSCEHLQAYGLLLLFQPPFCVCEHPHQPHGFSPHPPERCKVPTVTNTSSQSRTPRKPGCVLRCSSCAISAAVSPDLPAVEHAWGSLVHCERVLAGIWRAWDSLAGVMGPGRRGLGGSVGWQLGFRAQTPARLAHRHSQARHHLAFPAVLSAQCRGGA